MLYDILGLVAIVVLVPIGAILAVRIVGRTKRKRRNLNYMQVKLEGTSVSPLLGSHRSTGSHRSDR